MEDIDKLQLQFENISRLLDALLPFVSSEKRTRLYSMRNVLEPLMHIKEMMKTMEMIRAMQAMMNAGDDGSPDFSALSGFLSPEQVQMFEMFQSMQDMNV